MRSIVLFLYLALGVPSIIFAQTLKLNTGHSERVAVVKFSIDGKLLASGSWDNVIKVWDTKTGREIVTLQGHKDDINALAITNDSKYIVSGSSDRSIIIWEVKSGQIIKKIDGHSGKVAYLSLSPDEKYILSGDDRVFIIWDFKTGNLIKKFVELGQKTKIMVHSPNGRLIAFGGLPSMKLLDGETFNEVRTFNAYEAAYILFSPDQKRILTSAFWDKKINVWDTETGKELSSTSFNDPLIDRMSLIISPDWKFIFSGTKGGSIIQEEFDTGKRVKVFEPDENISNWIVSLDISNDGKYLASAGAKGIISIWDIKSGKEIKTMEKKVNTVGEVSISPDGMNFISVGSTFQFSSKLWRLNTCRTDNISWHKNDIRAVAFSNNSRLCITAGYDILLHDVQTLNEIRRWPSRQGYIKYSNFTPDDKKIFVRWEPNRMRHKNASDSIKLFDIDAGKLVGDFFVTNSSYELPKILEVNAGNEYQMYRNDMLTDNKKFRFSPDGQRYLEWGKGHVGCLHCPNEIEIMDSKTNQLLLKLKGHKDFVTSVTYSSNGKYIVSGSADGLIKVWDSETGDFVKELNQHTANVTSIDFDNFNRFISGSYDGTVKLWDLESGNEIATFVGLRNSSENIVFTPDNYYLGSKKAVSQNIHFVKGGKVFLFDQFDLQFNRPDIVLQRIGKSSPELIVGYKKAYDKRLMKLGFNPNNFEKVLSFNVPEIQLATSTELFEEVTKPDHTINFSAKDALFNLDRLFIDVNGVPVYGLAGKALKQNLKSVTFLETVSLSAGKNVIKISVLNEKGVESLAERIEITYNPPMPIKPNLHLITIGVSKFKDSNFNLTFAKKDADDLETLFRSASDRYGNINVYPFPDEKATHPNILALREKLEKTHVEDHVVVFIASHGVLDDDLDYFLAMHDMDFANPKIGGLRYDELNALIDGIPARNKLVLIDACHSGEVDKDDSELVASISSHSVNGISSRGFKAVRNKETSLGLSNSFELMKELFADLRRNNGAIVISAAAGKEFAFESSEWSNGVFTYCLLEGLKSGKSDLNKDNKVSVSELRDYVSKRVQELTAGKQNPTSRTENLENDFRVW